ncbi:MAG: kinase [Alphaproteobacteria bacterium]|nr:kinase [Alphaproteobacteria bacterium]
MIISRTPFRISLFGGGTDYPAWYRNHGGAVIGTTINKYCFISIRELPPFFEYRHRIVYSKVETVKLAQEIQHPVVRALLGERPELPGVEIHHDGDLPARSGLGSSSSFTVGMLTALNALSGRMIAPRELAIEAMRIEQDVLKENVGSQDQVWAAYGGTNHIHFRTDGTFTVTPVILSAPRMAELNSGLMLFFSGLSRIASEIAGKVLENMNQRRLHLSLMQQMSEDALTILQDEKRPLDELGGLLHESWRLKRELADGVSTPYIDDLYEAALSAGAKGGKLLGAGGGGFFLLWVPKEHQQAVRERLNHLVEVQITIGSPGSRVVLYEPNGF